MSFPASGLEATYRNNIADVSRLLRERHGGHFVVINLSERTYNNALFDHRVFDFGFPDHHAPLLEKLFEMCRLIDEHLTADENNVVCVHCIVSFAASGRPLARAAARLTR
jgi:hypothetical protein